MNPDVNQLKIVKEDSRYLWSTCPKHNYLEKPPLCINKAEMNGKPKGYGYCFSCGYRIDISPEEVDKMSNKKTICRKTVLIDWKKLNFDYEIQDLIKETYNILQQQWKVGCLSKYGIGWDGDAHTFPMRNEDGKIIGILRRFPDGHKCCVEGSQLGLFIPNMPITQVVVNEGLSDAAVSTECGFFGIGLPSASFGWKIVKKFLTNQSHYGIIRIVSDKDEAGRKSKDKLLKELIKWHREVISTAPYNDLKEYYLTEGKAETIRLLEGK